MARGRLLDGFDFSVLDDPSFKEDAVREEIVAPFLRELGYAPSGSTRVVRSKALVHPYVMIGSKKHRVNIVPDYTLFAGERPVLILDAKAPNEDVVASKHVEQAYSYSIHPEVRCEHYALCNGRRLVAFDVGRFEPILDLEVQSLAARWSEVVRVFGAAYLLRPELRDFVPDYGIHLLRGGLRERASVELSEEFVLMWLAMTSAGPKPLFSAITGCESAGTKYMVSLDFGQSVLDQILAALPKELGAEVREALSRQPFAVDPLGKLHVAGVARLGPLTRGADDWFVPLLVERVTSSRYVPEFKYEGGPDPGKPPAGTYRLR